MEVTMEPDDMFLKVEFTAYFPINDLNIEKREYANDSDANGIYYNKKLIIPCIQYYLLDTKDEIGKTKDLPKSMPLEPDNTSYHEEFITREQRWKDDPSLQKIDELVESNQSDKH
jgi:hypothetical protein